jgi:conjugative transfer region protein (TIGR03748 family)
MKPTYASCRAHIARTVLTMVVFLAPLAPLALNAAELTIGRYSTVQPSPSAAQEDPLAAPVVADLPASVTRIGEAMAALLAPSGYRLAPSLAAAPERAELLNLPLPEAHRTLAPLPLRTALKILVAPSFTLVEDPVHRLITFEACERTVAGH